VAEQLFRKQQAVGSNPTIGSRKSVDKAPVRATPNGPFWCALAATACYGDMTE
jgi:hypothetical protein